MRGIHNYATFLLEDYKDKLDTEGGIKLETLRRSPTHGHLCWTRCSNSPASVGLTSPCAETELNDVVEEVMDSLAINLKERGVEVRTPRPLPTIQADRVRIGEVFRNLITNSMKYNDKKEKWIEIGYGRDLGLEHQQAKEGERLVRNATVFYVRDNGIGIPDKHFEAIFRIFKRLHARDEFGGGTGVGLTIVKKIIKHTVGGFCGYSPGMARGLAFISRSRPRSNHGNSTPDVAR